MKKVVLVDDDASLQQLYRDALTPFHITTISSTNGEDGVSKIRSEYPNLVILDLLLSGEMNGIDVLRKIKNDPATAGVPVLVLSNLDTERETAKKLGAVDYLVKANTSFSDAIETIRKYLNA